MRQKIEFTSNGATLAGLLEMPNEKPRAYVLFAHCFTCGKDIAAASRISRFLVQRGFAVLRFDFTGLGNSDGDFANTNFSSNTADLLAAVDYLREHHQAPELLIGHSLGGAAILAMAPLVAEAKAVVTIAAPFEASHVVKNFHASLNEIETAGYADVSLGGRQFTIKKQFIDDIQNQSTDHLKNLNKALLIMHSPLDQTVNVSEAERIYSEAMHPKSFVSLDTADHLLSNVADSEYVAETIAGWASRYLPQEEVKSPSVAKGHVVVSELDHKFQQSIFTDHHHWFADEPRNVGGSNTGPDPYEHLLAALGACTAMTMRMYADRKKLALEHVEVSLFHSRDYLSDAGNAGDKPQQVESLHRHVQITGDLTEAQTTRLMEIADRCPVHRTLHNNPQVITKLV
ncbi:alpha/beta fold hydrolase [Reinekea sp.]|jgi:uncharacterized OsmC-like protein/alpha/beta superfamily hydrolase|uniref:bifunctional alpha/beta hydrolase/OsmC family protein n=1 Tax=Reinekea sp. TaxID=1970455 RepID=UPI00398922CC